MTEQIDVADRVQYLVLDELVVVSQALAIQYARLVQHDRILQTAAECEAGRAHRLDILHEPECPRTRDFLHVRRSRKIHDDLPIFGAEHRMRKIDREIETIAIERLETRPFVTIARFDRR